MMVVQYERLVFTVCYQLVRDYGEAQNLTQETFLSAYCHIDSCDEEKIKPWLARIAANKAKDFLKSAYHRHTVLSDTPVGEEIASGERSPDDIILTSEQETLIREKIHSLKEPYHKVSVMYLIEEKSLDEIAAALGRPKKTVQTQLYRAKLSLQGMLKGEREG
ncbi:MAG: RNA polymerase sigma factor [Acetanaerobacterium sp.]